MRHDVTFPLYVEVDEIYNLACPASPIHYQHDPVQTTKTSVHGAINMLGLAKRLGCRILQASTSEVYGDPSVHPQPEAYWGNVNPIGIRSCYDEGKRCAETLFFDYHRQHGVEIKVARIFNTYGPRMHPSDGRVVSNFIVQALGNEPITLYGRRRADAVLLLCRRSDRRPHPADGHARGRSRVRSIWATPASSPSESWRNWSSSRPARSRNWNTGRCRRTIRSSASPTSPWRVRSWDGNRAWPSRRACGRRSIILRRGSAETPCASLGAKPLRNSSSDWRALSPRSGLRHGLTSSASPPFTPPFAPLSSWRPICPQRPRRGRQSGSA